MLKKQDLIKSLIEAIDNINIIEDKIQSYIANLDDIQNKIMDIEHYLEVNKITSTGARRLIKELQMLRIQRRDIKQMWEVWNTYGKEKEKLKSRDFRPFIITEIYKKDKSLETVYKNRSYKEGYLDCLNASKKHKIEDNSYNNYEGEEI